MGATRAPVAGVGAAGLDRDAIHFQLSNVRQNSAVRKSIDAMVIEERQRDAAAAAGTAAGQRRARQAELARGGVAGEAASGSTAADVAQGKTIVGLATTALCMTSAPSGFSDERTAGVFSFL